jgi:thioester reductase-like protein
MLTGANGFIGRYLLAALTRSWNQGLNQYTARLRDRSP